MSHDPRFLVRSACPRSTLPLLPGILVLVLLLLLLLLRLLLLGRLGLALDHRGDVRRGGGGA